MNERSLSIVFGYLSGIDRQSWVAKKLSLPARFSIALDTYRHGHGEMYFDQEMLLAILKGLQLHIPHDSVSILFENNDEHTFQSLRDSIPVQTEKSASGNAPFISLRFLSGTETTCYIETEFYTAIGGPEPYHDSYNFAFYLKAYDRKTIENSIVTTCSQNHFTIRCIIAGRTIPDVFDSMYTRIKRFLFSR